MIGNGYDYRETVSVWFRSIFLLNPQPELMAEAPTSFQVHAVAGMLLFIIWPFTRLVHAFSAPVQYLFRPYVIYRKRGPHDHRDGQQPEGDEAELHRREPPPHQDLAHAARHLRGADEGRHEHRLVAGKAEALEQRHGMRRDRREDEAVERERRGEERDGDEPPAPRQPCR